MKWAGGQVVGYAMALLLGAGATVGLIAAMGGDVGLAVRTFLESALGNRVAFGQTLNKMSPLLLGGLAVALGLRAGCFNIGVDGQIYLGAIAATGLAFSLSAKAFPPVLVVGLVLLAGMAGGAFLAGIPAILRAYWGVSEIFVTVMLNFVAAYLVEYLATGPWNDPMAGEAITRAIPTSAELPVLLESAGTHGGIVLAVGAAALVWLLLERTRLGFEIGAVGDNGRAARVAGISIRRITLVALMASGAIAGLAGAIEVAGLHGRLILGLSPGYGVMAILIAVLGRNTAQGIAVASFGMAVLLVGSDSLQRSVGLPASAALVCQAIVVLTVLMLNAGTRHSPQ
jgi:ABC-type uncharacterized transport system permease subunit